MCPELFILVICWTGCGSTWATSAPCIVTSEWGMGFRILRITNILTRSLNQACLVCLFALHPYLTILLSPVLYPLSVSNISPQTRSQIGKPLHGSNRPFWDFSNDFLVIPYSQYFLRQQFAVIRPELDGDYRHEANNMADLKKIEVMQSGTEERKTGISEWRGWIKRPREAMKMLSSGAMYAFSFFHRQFQLHMPCSSNTHPTFCPFSKSFATYFPFQISLIIDKEPNTSIGWATRYSNSRDVEHDVQKEIETEINLVGKHELGTKGCCMGWELVVDDVLCEEDVCWVVAIPRTCSFFWYVFAWSKSKWCIWRTVVLFHLVYVVIMKKS